MANADANKNQGAVERVPGAGAGGTATPQVKESPKFVVDGKAVSEAEYFKAVEKSPWDAQFLRERKYYPEISTK